MYMYTHIHIYLQILSCGYLVINREILKPIQKFLSDSYPQVKVRRNILNLAKPEIERK